MNIFELVKSSVTTRTAAEYYGLKVNRHGMACCPFHNDKHPSFKIDKNYYCFGCGAKGDVIDYAARLFGLGMKDAALKICADFGLNFPTENAKAYYPKIRGMPKKSDEQIFRETEEYVFRVLSDYYHLLKTWETEYAPKTMDAEWHPYFVEALREKTIVEYRLDTLLDGDIHDRAFLIYEIATSRKLARMVSATAHDPESLTQGADCGRKVKRIAKRLQEFNGCGDSEGEGSIRATEQKSS